MAKTKLTFIEAVNNTSELSGHCKSGLSALGSDSSHVTANNPRLIDGSVDIDSCMTTSCPNDSRWDYVIGYNGNVFFVEVHPAQTSNVEEMIKKVVWLKNWLKGSAPDLLSLHKCGIFHWIPSGKVKILSNSSQARKIAQNNLKITKTIMVLG